LIYVVALIARISVDIFVIGPTALEFTIPTVPLTETAIIGETVTDLLLAFGIGLLIGRNIRVYQRYKMIISGKEPVAELP
jgi:hypothetical protein